MLVRATQLEIDVVRTNPNDAVALFRESVIPALHEEEGYEGVRPPRGRRARCWCSASGRATRRRELAAAGFHQAQIEQFVDVVFFRQAPGREAYDVVLAETPQEAIALGDR